MPPPLGSPSPLFCSSVFSLMEFCELFVSNRGPTYQHPWARGEEMNTHVLYSPKLATHLPHYFFLSMCFSFCYRGQRKMNWGLVTLESGDVCPSWIDAARSITTQGLLLVLVGVRADLWQKNGWKRDIKTPRLQQVTSYSSMFSCWMRRNNFKPSEKRENRLWRYKLLLVTMSNPSFFATGGLLLLLIKNMSEKELQMPLPLNLHCKVPWGDLCCDSIVKT